MNFVLLSHLWKEYNNYYLLFLKLLHSYHNISSKRIWTKVDDLQVTVLLILLFFKIYIGTTTYRSSKQIWTKVDDLTMLFVIFFLLSSVANTKYVCVVAYTENALELQMYREICFNRRLNNLIIYRNIIRLALVLSIFFLSQFDELQLRWFSCGDELSMRIHISAGFILL